MNAYNLSIVIAPVLVRSHSVQDDLEMCQVVESDKSPSIPWAISQEHTSRLQGNHTLGSVLKLMIERFGDIFSQAVGDISGAGNHTASCLSSPKVSSPNAIGEVGEALDSPLSRRVGYAIRVY